MKNNRKNRALMKIRIKNNLRNSLFPFMNKPLSSRLKQLIAETGVSGFKEIVVFKGASVGFSQTCLSTEELKTKVSGFRKKDLPSWFWTVNNKEEFKNATR